jgi:glycosyltransferase involved in cell wall biosynthesis
MVQVTVLFSTLNGAGTLPRMLDSLERLESPTGGWKVVAVDNGSDDNSLRLLEGRTGKLPMTLISEPRRGKNIALNTGLAHIDGEIVAFTDDDVILPTDWLIAIEKVAKRNPDYDIFGGAIYPVWEEPPPSWIPRVPKSFFACTDFPEGPVEPAGVWGGSMAARTAVLREHSFAEGIGPNGLSVYARGSETEFTIRAETAGHRCWHFRSAPVGHIIRPYQLKLEWLLRRAYNHGKGGRRRLQMHRRAHLTGFQYSLRCWLGLIKGVRDLAVPAAKVLTSRLSGTFDDRVTAMWQLRACKGDLDERLAAVLRPRHTPGLGRCRMAGRRKLDTGPWRSQT